MKACKYHSDTYAKQDSSEMRACLKKNIPKTITRDNIHPSSGGKKLLHTPSTLTL